MLGKLDHASALPLLNCTLLYFNILIPQQQKNQWFYTDKKCYSPSVKNGSDSVPHLDKFNLCTLHDGSIMW